MKKIINLRAVYQTGENCKITAIASIDKYFGEKLGFKPIPLHKEKKVSASIRQISKTKGSVQGELLEINQIPEILSDIGYETELVDVCDDFNSFKNIIKSTIDKGDLIIACFAVNDRTGLPSTIYNGENEHAAILHGYDDKNEKDELYMSHWGRVRATTMSDFFDSSNVLPKQRNPEYYINVKKQYPQKKYDLNIDQTGHFFPQGSIHKVSLTPTPGSGFRGKLIIIKTPQLSNILAARKHLKDDLSTTEVGTISSEDKKRIWELFKDLDLKIHELVTKGKKNNSTYHKVCEVARQLQRKLHAARHKFLYGRSLNLSEFKAECEQAIKLAEPEFKKHRGWHQVNTTFRKILGVLAALTIIPAIAIEFGAKKGFIDSFFKTPKTDSEEKLESLKQQLDCLK